VLPTIADCAPLCAVVLTEVLPLDVQPVSPDSNPGLTGPDELEPWMVHETLVLWVRLPLVPVTVIGYVPAAALPGESVSVEVPLPATLVGLSVALPPEGAPAAESETVPVKPLSAPTVTVDVPEPVTLAGFADMEKSGVAPPEQLVPQQMLSTECSSMPLGATPVWPWSTSKKPTPVTVTVSFAVWKEVVTAYFASKALREAVTCEVHELPVRQPGYGISAIIVLPAES
jgi:hypothetical protein